MPNIFTAKYFFNCACRDLGLEADHTIAIGKIVECKEHGYLDTETADRIAKDLYNAGRTAKYDQEEEDAFYDSLCEDYEEEDDSEMLDMGFNPYMGCYDFDC